MKLLKSHSKAYYHESHDKIPFSTKLAIVLAVCAIIRLCFIH